MHAAIVWRLSLMCDFSLPSSDTLRRFMLCFSVLCVQFPDPTPNVLRGLHTDLVYPSQGLQVVPQAPAPLNPHFCTLEPEAWTLRHRYLTQQLLSNQLLQPDEPQPSAAAPSSPQHSSASGTGPSSEPAGGARAPAPPSSSAAAASQGRQRTEPVPALGLEHFQSFAAAAASGEAPPETDMTALHMQGGLNMLVAA